MKSADINWIKNNWNKIPDTEKTFIKPNRYSKYIEGLSIESHFVVLLLNRQKPSVEASYDFDEERIGITRQGEIVWGFDSGCSCPSPWDDGYPECYNISKSWKEFKLNPETKFDADWEFVCTKKLEEIKSALNQPYANGEKK